MSPRGSWPSTVSVSARIGNVTTGIRSCWAKPLSMPPAFGALVISPPAGVPLGQTLGFAKRGRGYVAHGQPKLVLVRPLCAEARQGLTASFYLPLLPHPRRIPLGSM